MNDEIKKLLISEKDIVLTSQSERKLSLEERESLAEERSIEKYIQMAKDKGVELNNLIAKKLIDKYYYEQQNKLDLDPRKIDYFLDLADLRQNRSNNDKYNFERVMKSYAKEMTNDNKQIWHEFYREDSKKMKVKFGDIRNFLAIWYYRYDNGDDLLRPKYERYDLIYFDKVFFENQGIKVTYKKGEKRILRLEFNEKSLDNFVENVLSRKYSEVTLDNHFINRKKDEIGEIEKEKCALNEVREKSRRSANILALDVCKLAIQKYNEMNKYGDSLKSNNKTYEFKVDAEISEWAVKFFGGEKLKPILSKYDYLYLIAAVTHIQDGKERQLPIVIDDLNKILEEIGISGIVERSSKITFKVDVSKFEEAVLNASNEEVKKK